MSLAISLPVATIFVKIAILTIVLSSLSIIDILCIIILDPRVRTADALRLFNEIIDRIADARGKLPQ